MPPPSKWAEELLALQHDDGSWGYFHSLSEPRKNNVTTEHALRRLSILGYTLEDEPIQRAVEYMSGCLRGVRTLPDRREKTHNWDLFTSLILSAWIRRFTLDDPSANRVAAAWAEVLTETFSSGVYGPEAYVRAYRAAFGEKPWGGRLADYVSFYQVSLLSRGLDWETEGRVLDDILAHEGGIFYIYGPGPLSRLPGEFASKDASRYLGALELLAEYGRGPEKLRFAARWLRANRGTDGLWDLGPSVRDKLYFPLSDSWRKPGARQQDCTHRVQRLLDRLEQK